MTVLAGDIGGTSSRLALFERDVCVAERTYASRDFADFGAAVERFIAEVDARCDRACFAMAGPVRNNVCRTTNLPWPEVSGAALAARTGLAEVKLINDFAAQTVGVTALEAGEFEELLPGVIDASAPIAVLGAGTGLGEAIAIRAANGGTIVVAGEGGHGDFAPTDERQIMVLRELGALLGERVSYERVLSGPGLFNVYRALARGGYAAESAAVRARIDAASDASAEISREGLRGEDALCTAALEVFVEVYAQEASNMALRSLTFGGVYLAGGIAPKILGALKGPRFEQRFRHKPPHESVLREISVRVVMDAQLGLRGAAKVAAESAR